MLTIYVVIRINLLDLLGTNPPHALTTFIQTAPTKFIMSTLLGLLFQTMQC